MPTLILYNSNINSYLQCNNIELTWQIIKKALYEAMDLFVPKVRLEAEQFPKWFTPDLIHQLKGLCTLRKKCKHSPTTHNLQRLAIAETSFNSNIETAKAMYENSLIESMLSKSTSTLFCYLRSIQALEAYPQNFN